VIRRGVALWAFLACYLFACGALKGQWRYGGPPKMGPFLPPPRSEGGQPVQDAVNPTNMRVYAVLICQTTDFGEHEWPAVVLPPMTGQTYLLDADQRERNCHLAWHFDGN